MHEEAINKLASAGVISGRTATRFAPGTSVTRGGLATILVKGYELVVGQELRSGNDYFRDDHRTIHEPSINKLAQARLATGRTARRLRAGRARAAR